MKEIFYIIHSNSFGDTLAATPTLRYLYNSHQKKINVVTHNKNVFKNNPHVESILSFDEFVSGGDSNILKYESFTFPGQVDKNGIEKKFSHIDTRLLHSMDLGFQLLPENMSYDFYPDPIQLDVQLPESYVVLHTTTNWPNRTWERENWQKLINWLSEKKIFTVLIGFGYKEELHNSISDKPLEKICPYFDNLYGLDLTNQGSVSDMWWVINGSECIVTMDSGPLHIAGCTDTTILQLGSAINPKLRAPFRNGSQDYKYHYLSGTCDIFCNSNLFYNVVHWGDINHIPPQPGCLENKPTFECHPIIDKVIKKIEEVLNTEKNNPCDLFFEIYPKDDEDKIKYNYKKNSDKILEIVAKDVSTGLIRDRIFQEMKRCDGYYWWTPSPGRLENLGDLDLIFYINGEFQGKKRIHYKGGKELIVKNQKLYFDHIDTNVYSVFWEIELNNEYTSQPNCTVNDGDVVLDIGANFGFFTLNSLNKGAKKIYSVEPFSKAFQNLEKLSGMFPEIYPINRAVSSEVGVISFSVHSETSAVNCLSSHVNNDEKYEEVQVDTIDINTLLSSIPEQINFMKVDCEGAELEIFTTITNTNLKKIDRIVIETHSEEIDNLVYKKLLDTNFKVYKHPSGANNGGNILFAVKIK